MLTIVCLRGGTMSTKYQDLLAERLRDQFTLTDGESFGIGWELLIPILIEIITEVLADCPLFSVNRVQLAQQLQNPTILQRAVVRAAIRRHDEIPKDDRQRCCSAVFGALAASEPAEVVGFCGEMDDVANNWSPW